MTRAVRVPARVLTACAVLVGLVFMHTLGAAIGSGCPGGTSVMTTSVALPAVTGAHDAAMTNATMNRSGPAQPAIGTVPHHPVGHGTMCVATPPRNDAAGLLALTATGLAEPATPRRPAPDVAWVSGAVPRAGPDLLIRLGVSRT